MIADQAYRDGMRFFDLGNLAAATAGFELALRLDAAHIEARYELGNVLQQQQSWAIAAQHYQKVLLRDPAHARAHNNLGASLQMLGREADAASCYMQAITLAPRLAQPYINLGRLHQQAGRPADAATCYRQALEHCAERDTFSHLLAAIEGGAGAAVAAPAAYVRETFDGFAPGFDDRLIGQLDYRVPAAVAAALDEVRVFAPGSADVLDLGCGTGLAGAPLRARARHLTGVDLAPKMLAAARARGCYDVLAEADILAWMDAADSAAFDLVVAADVFIYLGDLADIFTEVARLLRPGGLFAFSVELSSREKWLLQPSGRYAQSHAYIASLAAASGLSVALRRQQPIRKPLVGALYILSRP